MKKQLQNVLLSLIVVAVFAIMTFFTIRDENYTLIDEKYIPNTPMPTATPGEFSVVLEVVRFDKNEERMCCIDVLWIVKVLDTERPLPQKRFFLGLGDSSKLELKPGTKIKLYCTGVSWARDDELDCSQDYEILDN